MALRTKSWRFVVLKPGSTSELAAVFAHSRTGIVRVALEIAGQPPRLFHVERFVATLGLPNPLDLGTGEPPVLRVSFAGDSARLVRMAWVAPRGRAGGRFFVQPAELPVAQAECRSLWNLAYQSQAVVLERVTQEQLGEIVTEASLGSDDLFRLRRQAIDDHAAAQQFFLHLDAGTHPGMMTADWQATIGEVSYQLARRLDERILVGADDEVPLFAAIEADDPFGEKTGLSSVSLFLQSLVVSHLYDGQPRDLVDWTFELFATDQLAVSHREKSADAVLAGHGAPNGVLFFQFAELAFFCLDNNVQTAFWHKHLETLVRTAHVFCEHGIQFQDPGSSYPYTETDYAYDEARFYPRSRLDELRAEYSARLAAVTGDAGLTEAQKTEKVRKFLEDRFTSAVSQALLPGGGSPLGGVRALTNPATLLKSGSVTLVP